MLEERGESARLWREGVVVAGWFGLRHNLVLRARVTMFPARAGRREQPGWVESDEWDMLYGEHDEARRSCVWREVVGRVQGELSGAGWLWVLYDLAEGGKEVFDVSRV